MRLQKGIGQEEQSKAFGGKEKAYEVYKRVLYCRGKQNGNTDRLRYAV